MNFIPKTKKQCQLFVYNKIEKLYSKNLTQTKVAALLDVSSRCVRKWERFESTPNAEQLLNIMSLCKSLGV